MSSVWRRWSQTVGVSSRALKFRRVQMYRIAYLFTLIALAGVTTNGIALGQTPNLLAGGQEHSLALKSDGTIWAWGSNEYGQLGNGGNANSKVLAPGSGMTGEVC